jgi:hypothetical protein
MNFAEFSADMACPVCGYVGLKPAGLWGTTRLLHEIFPGVDTMGVTVEWLVEGEDRAGLPPSFLADCRALQGESRLGPVEILAAGLAAELVAELVVEKNSAG